LRGYIERQAKYMEKRFNLLMEPWIKVIDKDCREGEVSLIDLYKEANQWQSFNGETQTQDVAVMRLCLSVLHSIFARYDINGEYKPIESPEDALARWSSLWMLGKLPIDIIEKYLTKFEDRFWLIHPTTPFYQIASLEDTNGITYYKATKLNGTILQSGRDGNLRHRVLSQIETKTYRGMGFSEATRWLLHLNGFDDSSGKVRKEIKAELGGKVQSSGLGWLGQLGLISANGENLHKTLLLNLVLLPDGSDNLWVAESPIWERSVRDMERVEIGVPRNPSELLTLQSRRVFLDVEGEEVKGYKLLGGDFFGGSSKKEKSLSESKYVEQMTLWKEFEQSDTEKKEKIPKIYKPHKFNSSKAFWKDFMPLLVGKGSGRVPGVVGWVSRLKVEGLIEDSIINFNTYGAIYDEKNSSIKDYFTDTLSINIGILTSLGEDWTTRIQEELAITEIIVWHLGKLAVGIAKASGFRGKAEGIINRITEEANYELDIPFRKWLNGINPGVDGIGETCDKWYVQSRDIAIRIARELVNKAGTKAIVGRTIKEGRAEVRYNSAELLDKFILKIYNKNSLLRKESDKSDKSDKQGKYGKKPR